MLQDGEITVGLYREAQCVRQSPQPSVEVTIGIFNRPTAVHIGRCPDFSRDRAQRDFLAKDFFAAGTRSGRFLPCKVWCKFSRIDKLKPVRTRTSRCAHLTFVTTSVRSSESGAPSVNQSTSRRMMSAISVADDS